MFLVSFNIIQKIALLDTDGEVVVRYYYDAWGNCSTAVVAESYRNLAEANPFRYRGYYYDKETGLYYLQTRYYDPEVGRFITIDDISYIDPETINGLNLYAYCGNNPVMRVDPTGTDWNSFCAWWGNAWNTVKNWAVNTWNTVSTWVVDTAYKVGNWFSQNWDIVVGVTLIAIGVVTSIVTFGATTSLFGIAFGGLLGAAFGALSSYRRKENVGLGFLNGLIVGITGGVNGIAGALVAAGMSFIIDRINGVKADGYTALRALTNAVIAGLFAEGSTGFAKLIISGAEELALKGVAYFIAGFIFSAYSFVADKLTDLFWGKM